MIAFNPTLTQSLPPDADSKAVLANLQQTFGAVRYSDQQMTRYPFYSYIEYPAAGAGSLGFFGTNMGQSSAQLTNIEQAGTLGNYSYLLQSISFDAFFLIPTTANSQPNAYTVDTAAVYADMVHGFSQAGYWDFVIGNTTWDQCPVPFMFSPPGTGRNRMDLSQGAFAFTQAGLTPFAVTGAQTNLCYADLERRANRRRPLSNPIFIAPQQTFQASISYDFGNIPIIATGIVTGAAKLYVGVRFDGWKFSPVS